MLNRLVELSLRYKFLVIISFLVVAFLGVRAFRAVPIDAFPDVTPAQVNIVSLQHELRRVEGVESVHDLHVWTLTSGVLAMSCHVVISNGQLSRNQVLAQVNGLARERFQIDHTTVQIEEAAESVMDSCDCHFGAWDSLR